MLLFDVEHLMVPVLSEVVVSLLLFAGGFFIGRYRERKQSHGKNLEEYDFYPFINDKDNFPCFNLDHFRTAVRHFVNNKDHRAARQLIFIGEQNNVRFQLESHDRVQYEKVFRQYHGEKIVDENNAYLENYKRLVRLFGQTFKHMGIEILLHNLMNPSHSIAEIESGEVTGRKTGLGTTSLVLDLKKRRSLNEDKLNYELNIGARRFKCTTVPIFRSDYGLIAAVCINIDINYINDSVLKSQERLKEFFENYCKTDMMLDENILSKEEFKLATAGKRHWLDTVHSNANFAVE